MLLHGIMHAATGSRADDEDFENVEDDQKTMV